MKLFYKFFISISLTLILAILVTTSIYIVKENENHIEESYVILDTSINEIESSFDIFFESFSSLAISTANNDIVKQFLENYDLSDSKNVENIIDYLKKSENSSDLINNVLLVPKNGEMYINAAQGLRSEPSRSNTIFYY